MSARQLLGLPERFTGAELRRAWLRLVRELHPDRRATSGSGVRQMKEAAMKRVNAARDELTQAFGWMIAVPFSADGAVISLASCTPHRLQLIRWPPVETCRSGIGG